VGTGHRLTFAQLATGVALSVLVSMGSVGLPGQAIFIATNLPVTQAMGLPIAPLPVLMAVDAIPDVLATVGNVTADMTANALVASRDDGKDETPDLPARNIDNSYTRRHPCVSQQIYANHA
jgi:Na+/H+-dicarboxylate symporter